VNDAERIALISWVTDMAFTKPKSFDELLDPFYQVNKALIAEVLAKREVLL